MSRLRLIAGPNGSGKSSIFQKIKAFKENQKSIRTGPFLNSDDIEKSFKENGSLDLRQFDIGSPPASLIEDYLGISTFKGKYFSYGMSSDPEDINFWQPGGKLNFMVSRRGSRSVWSGYRAKAIYVRTGIKGFRDYHDG